jgi:hypothetical protein
MKELPLERVWTGDGRGATDAVTHTQIKRTETVAMYSVTNKDGKLVGYEVFTVKTRLKGQPLPGGLFEEEDREVYPSANSFGKTAWAPGGLAQAESIYANLVNGKGAHDVEAVENEDNDAEEVTPVKTRQKKERPALTVPVVEFSVKELAEQNDVDYPIAAVFVKEALIDNLISFVREERRNVKGKATKIYKKA